MKKVYVIMGYCFYPTQAFTSKEQAEKVCEKLKFERECAGDRPSFSVNELEVIE